MEAVCGSCMDGMAGNCPLHPGVHTGVSASTWKESQPPPCCFVVRVLIIYQVDAHSRVAGQPRHGNETRASVLRPLGWCDGTGAWRLTCAAVGCRVGVADRTALYYHSYCAELWATSPGMRPSTGRYQYDRRTFANGCTLQHTHANLNSASRRRRENTLCQPCTTRHTTTTRGVITECRRARLRRYDKEISLWDTAASRSTLLAGGTGIALLASAARTAAAVVSTYSVSSKPFRRARSIGDVAFTTLVPSCGRSRGVAANSRLDAQVLHATVNHRRSKARHHHSRLRAGTYILLCIRVRAGVRQKLRHRAAVDFGHGDDGRFKHGVTQRGVAKLPSQSRGHRHTRRDTPTRTSTIRPTASFPLALGSCQRRQRAPCPARSGRRRRTTGSGRRPRDRATLRCAAGSTHAGSTKRQPHTTIKRCSNRQAKTDVSGTRVWWPSTSGRPPSIAEGRPPSRTTLPTPDPYRWRDAPCFTGSVLQQRYHLLDIARATRLYDLLYTGATDHTSAQRSRVGTKMAHRGSAPGFPWPRRAHAHGVTRHKRQPLPTSPHCR